MDGLRAIAILSVLGFHAFPQYLPGGFVGVDIFFVLSGYLISGIIFRNLENNSFSIGDFYCRRVKRIFPALAVVMLACLAAGWFLLFPDEYAQLGVHTASGTAFLSNVVLWGESGYFDNAANTKPLLHLWSLAVEEQFYLVWPPLLLLLGKRRMPVLPAVLVLGGLSFAANILLADRHASAAFYLPLSRFWELMAGALLAHVSLHRPQAIGHWKDGQSALGLLLVAFSLAVIDDRKVFPGWWALAPAAGTLLILSAGPAARLNRVLLANRAAIGIGLVSYPLYLWHWPILTFQRMVVGGEVAASGKVAALACALVMAFLTYALVEKNLRYSESRLTVPGLALSFALICYASGLVFLDAGLPDRAIARSIYDDLDVWNGARSSDGSCKKLLGQQEPSDEVCLTTSASPRFLFGGDSHAMALYSAIHGKDIPADAMLMAWHSCPLYPNLEYAPIRKNAYENNCAALARTILATAENSRHIDTVVLTGYLPAVDAAISRYSLDGKPLTDGEAFFAGSQAMVGALLGVGKKVVWVLDIPHLKNTPKNCVGRIASIDANTCSPSTQENKEIRQEYMLLAGRLQQVFPALVIYDPTPLFCPDAICNYRMGKNLLYVDEHHISPFASRMLLNDMRQKGILDF